MSDLRSEDPIRYRLADKTAWTQHIRGWISLRQAIKTREGTILYITKGHNLLAALDIKSFIEAARTGPLPLSRAIITDNGWLCEVVQATVNKLLTDQMIKDQE